MYQVMAITVGGLYAAGIYLILQRNIVRLIVGLVLLSHATNLLILTAGGLTRGSPPVIDAGQVRPQEPIANPLPQALILTAIVISLAIQAFVLTLISRTATVAGTGDLQALKTTEKA